MTGYTPHLLLMVVALILSKSCRQNRGHLIGCSDGLVDGCLFWSGCCAVLAGAALDGYIFVAHPGWYELRPRETPISVSTCS